MNLSLENLIDLRRIVTSHIHTLGQLKSSTPEVKREADRQIKSFAESLSQITQEIKDIQFEMEKLNF
jgi:hypothetical protein